MSNKRRVLALLELGWTYRRIERETGVRRETIARYDPQRQPKAANLSTGTDVSADEGMAKAANLSAGSKAAHGPPGLAAPYHAQIEAGLRQGLTAQRIYQDLCQEFAYPHKYASVRRYVRRLKRQHPKLVDVMQHPPGEEAQVDFFQGPPTFDEAQGRWRRPWIFRMTLSCSKHGYEEPLWTQDRDGFLRAHERAFVRLGGVAKVVRHDNLKAAVVRACLYDPDVSEVYAAFAKHWGFVPLPSRPRHPEEKGVVEHLYGYAQRDLLVPALLEPEWRDLDEANAVARRWCAEVNGQVHSETYAVPAERLLSERDVLRPLPAGRPPLRAGEARTVDKRGSIRFGSARYLVPKTLVGESVEVVATEDKVVIQHDGTEVIRHDPVGPGEVACGDLVDPHRRPARGIRPRTEAELTFVGLGPVAEVFLRNAAAAGTLRLEHELTTIVELLPVWSRDAVIKALDRATRFRRFKASDVRAILEAGHGVPTPVRAGQQLALELPDVPVRSLNAYAVRAVSA